MEQLDVCRHPADVACGGNAHQAPPAPSPDGAKTGPAHPTHLDLLPFAEVWAVDFEFIAKPGDNPEPVCLVAWELRNGRKLRLWKDELGGAPPYSTGPDALFVAYYASAEIGCHLALGWPVPARVLDLFTEFRNHTNGTPTPSRSGLLGALAYFGLDSIGATEKNEMRDLILRGEPYTSAERAAILDYCESDVAALSRLLPAMLPHIDLPRAVLRGRYMAAAARVERNGVPIDTATLELLRRRWSGIQDQLIVEIARPRGWSACAARQALMAWSASVRRSCWISWRYRSASAPPAHTATLPR